jgi:hypothetical protein
METHRGNHKRQRQDACLQVAIDRTADRGRGGLFTDAQAGEAMHAAAMTARATAN